MRRVIITMDPDSPTSGHWVVEDWLEEEGALDRVVRASFDHMTHDLTGDPLGWRQVLRTAAGDLV